MIKQKQVNSNLSEMKSKKDALAILGKTLLYIVAVAMAFAFIILAWEKYDWLPTVRYNTWSGRPYVAWRFDGVPSPT